MRTMLTLDNDILAAAKGFAATLQQTIAEMVSAPAHLAFQRTREPPSARSGVPLLALSTDSQPVAAEAVNQLDDEWQ